MLQHPLSDAVLVTRIIQQIPNWPREEEDWRLRYDLQGQVQRLDLSRLDLTAVVPGIEALTNIQELNLSYNQLTYLPEELGQLWLDHNRLIRLPKELSQLEALEELVVENNASLRIPPSEVVVDGVKAILKYLRNLPDQR